MGDEEHMKFICNRCGGQWAQKPGRPIVTFCPHCKSPNWQRPVYIGWCWRCGHTWILRQGETKPTRCANKLCRAPDPMTKDKRRRGVTKQDPAVVHKVNEWRKSFCAAYSPESVKLGKPVKIGYKRRLDHP